MPLEQHEEHHGKIAVTGKVSLETQEDMSRAYTPGVAEVVAAIQDNPDDVYTYTAKGEMVGIVTDGTAVLGMGDVGPKPAIPVMEGKALLLNELAGVSGFPVVLDETDPDEIISLVERLEPMYGFMMLEDISSPKCFHIEEELKQRLEIPVFHDDQHGAAIAVLAGLKNALTVVDKQLQDASIVVVGAGAAGIATTQLLDAAGATQITVVDQPGIIGPDTEGLYPAQQEIAAATNPDGETGSLTEAVQGADVVIGLATGGIISQDMVRSMAENPIVFALSNPDPEIAPEDAKQAGAAVVGTGRSDYPNQVNNSLVFPGVAKGCLSCFASDINTEMKLAAADAVAAAVETPTAERVLPSALDTDVHDLVAQAVTETGQSTGACRVR